MNYDPFEITHMTRWAAQECEWQGSGELSVSRLIDATLFAIDVKALHTQITVDNIKALGRLIDSRNNDGFRQEPVWVGNNQMAPWGEIPFLIDYWVESFTHASPPSAEIAFTRFEKIHPFVDGNGRTGAILYNWLNGTLEPGKLVFPPNVFGDPRR